MRSHSPEHLIRAFRTAGITIIVAAVAYGVLDGIAERRIQREALRQQMEYERALAAGDSTIAPSRTVALLDGSGGSADDDAQDDGECTHAGPEVLHRDPVALVKEYVQRDGAGQFLSETEWRSSAVACPEQLSGAEQAAVVAGYVVRPLATGADTALIEVTYRRAGLLTQRGGEEEEVSSTAFVAEPRTEVDTFVVVRDGDTWRIHAPMLEQHVLPATALRHFALPPADRRLIQAIRS